MAKPRAIGYVRVSTTEQMAGYGLDVQERALRDYCRRDGLRLVGIERDEGASGSNGLDSRHGLARALAVLDAGNADVLVVPSLDRLARDVVVSETVIRRLQAAGREVRSVAEPDGEGDDHTRRLVRVMLGAIAEYEAAVIRGRMLAGKAAKVARGGYGGGKPRYGKRAAAGELVDDPDEARLVERVRELRAAGKSYRAICSVLDAEGFQPRRAKQWYPMVVRSIATQ